MVVYNCPLCNYITTNKQHYSKHLTTTKHLYNKANEYVKIKKWGYRIYLRLMLR